MALTGWQSLFLMLFAMFLLTIYAVRWGLIIWSRYMRAFPDYEGFWYNDDGTIKEKRIIQPQGGLGDKSWKLQHTNPTKVKFKVLPFHLGRAEPREWDNDDKLELKYANSGNVKIIFNLKGYNNSFSMEKSMLVKMLNQKVTEAADNKARADELETRMEEKIDRRFKEAKQAIALIPQKPTGKKT